MSPLPDWWDRDLYNVFRDDHGNVNLPPEGYTWEFARRARLLNLFRGARPVDAMNPAPNLNIRNEIEDLLYMSWPQVRYRFGQNSVYYPPSVTFSQGWPPQFRGQRIQVNFLTTQQHSNWVEITIKVDMNRRNNVIARDFMEFLGTMRNRENISEPSKLGLRQNIRSLEVWDLRQFGLSWNDIEELLEINDDNAHNIYKRIAEYIDNGKWERLARYHF